MSGLREVTKQLLKIRSLVSDLWLDCTLDVLSEGMIKILELYEKEKQTELQTVESKILFYTAPDGAVKIDVFFQDKTAWLTQKRMAELFAVEINTINYHIKEIFKSEELAKEATIRKIRIVQKEGVRSVERDVEFYNLDMIISV